MEYQSSARHAMKGAAIEHTWTRQFTTPNISPSNIITTLRMKTGRLRACPLEKKKRAMAVGMSADAQAVPMSSRFTKGVMSAVRSTAAVGVGKDPCAVQGDILGTTEESPFECLRYISQGV